MYIEDFKDYAKHCDLISAPRNVDEKCLNPEEGSCYVTQSAKCLYKGSVLEKQDAPDYEFCRNLCSFNSGCQRWVFHKESKKCELYDSTEQDCNEVFGPPSKSASTCGEGPPPLTTPGPGTTTTLTTGTAEFCESDTVGLFEDKDNCAMYYLCVEGSVTHQTCPDCDKFDTESGYCKQPNLVDCNGRPYNDDCTFTTKGGDCPLDYGYFPLPEDCTDYVICEQGIPEYKVCRQEVDETGVAQQLMYNPDNAQCDWTYRVSCGPRPVCDNSYCQCQYAVPVKPGFECNGLEDPTVISDPFNCQASLICIDGSEVERFSCEGATYYDENIDECVEDESVCGERPICVPAGGDKTSCYCVV